MQRFHQRYEACYEEYSRELRGQWWRRLSYEELCEEPEPLRAALEYLGVASDIDLPPLDETVKQSSGPISRAIANYAEVECIPVHFAWQVSSAAEALHHSGAEC